MMFTSLLLLFVACIALWILVNWLRVRRYWADRGVPHVSVYPFIGSLTFLMRYNPAIWVRDIYERYNSPYVGIWLFSRPGLVVNDLEIARNILIKDASVFRDRFASSQASDPIGYLNMFTANGTLWSSVRRRLTAVFTTAKLKGSFTLMRTKSKELIRRVENEMMKNKYVDLRLMFTDYTTDVVGSSAFGVAGDATLTSEGPLRSVTKDLMQFSVFRGLSWVGIFFFPELVDIFRFKAFPQRTTDLFRQIFRTIVHQRGGYDAEIKENRDLFDALIKMKQDCAKDGEDISEDTLVAQAAIFLQGGFDTTGSILAYCAYELAFHPDVQAKLYEELEAQVKKTGTSEFDSDSLSELKYLDCIINETLRKYQPMGWLDRVAIKDYQIDEHLTITAGTPVYINVMGMHYDPKYYPDPEVFNPDRFMSENDESVRKLTFMPFGEGPRSCIGRRFAMMNLRSAIASIFLAYEGRVAAHGPHPSKAKIEPRNLFLAPGVPLLAEFVKRN